MLAEFRPVPICLELDFDSFDGPPHWVARLRRTSGWFMVAEATIQSEHDIMTERVVVACDERENPIPSFKAVNLLHCEWLNPTCCDELPPDILEDLICEEEGALIARWHREKNSALAEAFEASEKRIAELEGRDQFTIARNEARIGELRQRRRHPDATLEMREAMAKIINDLDAENDELLAEMAATRAAIRDQALAFEETLWAREDLLLEVTPIHVVRWKARTKAYGDIPGRPKQYATQWIPACGPTGGATPGFKNVEDELAAGLAKTAANKVVEEENGVRAVKGVKPAPPKADRPKPSTALPKHSPVLQALTEASSPEMAEDQAAEDTGWTHKRVELLKSMWLAGESASTIANALGNVSRNAVIGKADRLKLPRTRGPNAPPGLQKSVPCASASPPRTEPAAPSPWTPRSIEMLERLWRDGMSAKDIAPALGVSREAVVEKLQALGLALKTRCVGAEEAAAQAPEAARIEPEATPPPAAVQNALSALSAARKRYYGQD